MKYAICIHGGCISGETKILSIHATLDSAKSTADKSDRTCVVGFNDGDDWMKAGYRFTLRDHDVIYAIPPQNDPSLGQGRYGNGLEG